MEDLCERGFTMKPQPPESYEDSKMIVQRLAKFHAAGFYLSQEKVKMSEIFSWYFIGPLILESWLYRLQQLSL